MKNQHSTVEEIYEPSGRCQACLSAKVTSVRDNMLCCDLCKGSVHKTHYGVELGPSPDYEPDKWYCQRCHELIKTQFRTQIKCEFCPSIRGIMKKVQLDSSQVWLHPECYTWSYPIVSMTTGKRTNYRTEFPNSTTSKFWIGIDSRASCSHCGDASGHKIKCAYYSCSKHYHATCGKKLGFIRDLETMKFDHSEVYIPPYCEQHLLLRIDDCRQRLVSYQEANLYEKVSHFSKVQVSFTNQLYNMRAAVEKCAYQQRIREKFYGATNDANASEEEYELQQCSNSFHTRHADSFYDFLDLEEASPSKVVKKDGQPNHQMQHQQQSE